MKKVVFFNHWHNGDVHVSRGIVRQIMNKVFQQDPSIEFYYTHRNASDLLLDIPDLKFDANLINNINPHDNIIIQDDTVYINTWYDQQHQKYARQYGILTIDALYAALDESCKKVWSFSLQNISTNVKDFFPVIDYSKFYIEKVECWLHQNRGIKVLVENGNGNSNQAYNFPLIPIIINIAKKNPNITFILSQKEDINLPNNVLFTSDIIQKFGNDLNEISFLSTHCDMIIGKASGVFSFTITRDNLFERKVKLLCFSYLMQCQSKFWLGKLFQNNTDYSATIEVSGEYLPALVENIIERNLHA